MRKAFMVILSVVMLLMIDACDRADGDIIPQNGASGTPQIETTQDLEGFSDSDRPERSENGNEENNMTNISITVGSSVFAANLYDNDGAKALLALFPITLDMYELNGNEKYSYLPVNLPTDSKPAGYIILNTH